MIGTCTTVISAKEEKKITKPKQVAPVTLDGCVYPVEPFQWTANLTRPTPIGYLPSKLRLDPTTNLTMDSSLEKQGQLFQTEAKEQTRASHFHEGRHMSPLDWPAIPTAQSTLVVGLKPSLKLKQTHQIAWHLSLLLKFFINTCYTSRPYVCGFFFFFSFGGRLFAGILRFCVIQIFPMLVFDGIHNAGIRSNIFAVWRI